MNVNLDQFRNDFGEDFQRRVLGFKLLKIRYGLDSNQEFLEWFCEACMLLLYLRD